MKSESLCIAEMGICAPYVETPEPSNCTTTYQGPGVEQTTL